MKVFLIYFIKFSLIKFLKQNLLETKNILRNPHMILKMYNDMRFPFGLTDKRFRWQESKNIGEKMELKGNLIKRFSKSLNKNDTSFSNEINSSGIGSWQSLIEKTEPNIKPKRRSEQ